MTYLLPGMISFPSLCTFNQEGQAIAKAESVTPGFLSAGCVALLQFLGLSGLHQQTVNQHISQWL